MLAGTRQLLTRNVSCACACVSAHTCLGTSIYNAYSVINIDCLNMIPNVDNHV